MKRILKKVPPLIMITLVSTLLFSTNPIVNAASKTPKKISMHVSSKTVDIKGESKITIKALSNQGLDKTVTLKSSNNKIATVSSKGIIHGKKSGKVKITGTLKKNKKVSDTVTITVKDLKPSHISTYKSLTLKAGEKKNLNVKISPSGVYCPVSYKTTNNSVANVSSKGIVTASKDGKATITITAKQRNKSGKYISSKCNVTVSTRINKITFEKKSLILKAKDSSGNNKVTFFPSNAGNKSLKYTSSNEAVATVSAKGIVTAKDYGSTTITATTIDGSNIQASYNVTVVKPDAVSTRQVFVTPEWLKSVIDGDQPEYKNALIADASWLTDYCSKAHIPTAIHINSDEVEYVDWTPWGKDNVVGNNIDDLWDYNRNGNNYGKITYGDNDGEVPIEQIYNLRSDNELKTFFKRYGITKDTKVILYGKSGNSSDTGRVAFAMLSAGVKDVKILDGGITGWEKLNLPTTTETVSPTPGNNDFGNIEHKYILSIDQVNEKLKNDANFKLVSIRSRDEFEGVKSNYAYIETAGEPLGAVWGKNINDYVQDSNFVIPLSQMKEYLTASNIDYTKNELSFYCGTGWRATIPFFLAYQDGKDNISVYDGGWYQWELRWKDNPKEYPRQKITPEQAAYYSKMQFTKKSVSVSIGSTVNNSVNLYPASASASIKYEVEDSSIASVDSLGNITGKSEGSTTLTATAFNSKGEQIGKRITSGIVVEK